MKEEYISRILECLNNCNDLELLDFILKLIKSRI